eukprot:gene6713-13606_t
MLIQSTYCAHIILLYGLIVISTYATIPESLRLERLDLFYSNQSIWLMAPDWIKHKQYPGADYYAQVHINNRFNSGQQKIFEKSITAMLPEPHSSCFFIQAGSHLGAFCFLATAMGCRSTCIDGYLPHVEIMRLNSYVNRLPRQKFKPIWAAVGDSNHKNVSFHIAQVASKVGVPTPMISLDGLCQDTKACQGDVGMIVIDVEGFEQDVIKGAKHLITSKKVKIWCIELWYDNIGQSKQLNQFWDVGYKSYMLIDSKSILVPISKDEVLKGTLRAKGCGKPNAPACMEDIYFTNEETFKIIDRIPS